jgi:hypothetical protein
MKQPKTRRRERKENNMKRFTASFHVISTIACNGLESFQGRRKREERIEK